MKKHAKTQITLIPPPGFPIFPMAGWPEILVQSQKKGGINPPGPVPPKNPGRKWSRFGLWEYLLRNVPLLYLIHVTSRSTWCCEREREKKKWTWHCINSITTIYPEIQAHTTGTPLTVTKSLNVQPNLDCSLRSSLLPSLSGYLEPLLLNLELLVKPYLDLYLPSLWL